MEMEGGAGEKATQQNRFSGEHVTISVLQIGYTKRTNDLRVDVGSTTRAVFHGGSRESSKVSLMLAIPYHSMHYERQTTIRPRGWPPIRQI
jgi:hypothetical protein